MTTFALLVALHVPPLPPLEDMRRFAPTDYYWSGYQFGGKFLREMEQRRHFEVDRVHRIDVVIREAEHLRAIWYAAYAARCESWDDPSRRESQRELIRLIGWRAYWKAELPPCVPVWTFSELRRP